MRIYWTDNDTDVDGTIDPTSVTEVTPPTNGSISIDPTTGDITYTPDPNFNGTDIYVYSVCDDDGDCGVARKCRILLHNLLIFNL